MSIRNNIGLVATHKICRYKMNKIAQLKFCYFVILKNDQDLIKLDFVEKFSLQYFDGFSEFLLAKLKYQREVPFFLPS